MKMNDADEIPMANKLFKLCDELFENKSDSATETFPKQVIYTFVRYLIKVSKEEFLDDYISTNDY